MFHLEGPPCIVGRYRLLGRALGKGNYARVEEALHLDLQDAHVAVKMIDTHTVQERYVLRHLHREAKVLRHLKHPNIIAIFEVLRAGSHYCIVTELVGGGELCAHVSRQPRGRLDEPATLQFGAQLISAVAHMHSLNVVHRDLKTKNIVLTRRGDQVKIVDFGLGRTWSPADPLRTHCGSPGYAAPEIYQRDRPYGPEVDLWSLGVVLYYMAVGSMPFPPCRDKGRSEEDRRRRLLAIISKGATEQHVKLMGHYSPDFRDLVQGLLTAKVSRRLTLQQTLEHPWVSNRLRARQMINIQYKLSSQERALVLTKLAIMRKITVQAIVAQCRQDALGEVGTAGRGVRQRTVPGLAFEICRQIAAMYNIMEHKQLSTYHATWALRPAGTRRLTAELAAATAAAAAMEADAADGVAEPRRRGQRPGAAQRHRPGESHAAAPEREHGNGRANSDDSTVPTGTAPPATRCRSRSEETVFVDEGRVDHPDSSADEDAGAGAGTASWATSLSTERSRSLDDLQPPGGGHVGAHQPLPPPPQPLALLHNQEVAVDGGRVDGGAADEQEAAPPDTPPISVGKETDSLSLSSGGGLAAAITAGEYKVACLLPGEDGRERLEPLPDTKVMFYTSTVLDNVHEALAAVNSPKSESKVLQQLMQPAGPAIKSALASQTGLATAARTRKAVSFSIIATKHSDSTTAAERRRDTGVQVNLLSVSGGRCQDVGALPEGDNPYPGDATPTGCASTCTPEADDGLREQVPTAGDTAPTLAAAEAGGPPPPELPAVATATASASEGSCGGGLSRQDAAKFLKTVPVSRKVSPEPKKNIYEARRWPMRSPRTVYKRIAGHSRLSLSCLLTDQENLINIICKNREGTAPPTTPHSAVLVAHEEKSTAVENNMTKAAQETGHEHKALSSDPASHSPPNPSHDTIPDKILDCAKRTKKEGNGRGEAAMSQNVRPASANRGSTVVTSTSNKNTSPPLNTVAEGVQEKAQTKRIKAKSTKVKPKQEAKERRGKAPGYQRFFPNRYRVDLALVMTLERSRKSNLPSIHRPWTSPKPDVSLYPRDM